MDFFFWLLTALDFAWPFDADGEHVKKLPNGGEFNGTSNLPWLNP